MITQATARELVEALDGARGWLTSFAPNELFELIETTLAKARKEMEDATQNAKN